MNNGPVLIVVFFRSESGREPVREWLKDLAADDRKTVGEDIKLVQFRWPLGMPLVGKLEPDLWKVRSRRFSEAGRAWILAHPDQFLALTPKKLLRTWSPTSFSVQFGRQVPPSMAIAIGIPYVLFLMASWYGIWLARGQWNRGFPLLAVILSVNLLVVIYSGATRYGIPMTVSFIPVTALAIDRLLAPEVRALSRETTAHGEA